MESSKKYSCKSILVIEDDEDIRETIRDLLESEGYRVVLAKNGQEGLKALDQEVQHPCFILLDLMMPVMNGFEFLESLRRDRKDLLSSTPIIVLSAIADIDKAKQPEVLGFMKKPFQIDNLLNTAKEYCA